MEQQEYAQRGYLREDFRLFHLKGAMEEQLDWHYHTFHKLIFFLGGQSGYGVEGRSYPLEPGDVILVPQGCVHRPEAAPGAPYERVILYLSPDYLARAGTAECPLDSCFTLATARFRFVLRPQEERQALRRTLFALESASAQPGFGQELLAKAGANLTVDLPEAMLDRTADNEMRMLEQRLSRSNITLEKHCKNSHTTAAALRAGYRDAAERNLRSMLASRSIAEAENITVSTLEVNNEYRRLSQLQDTPEADIRRVLSPDTLAAALVAQKVQRFLLDNAAITTVMDPEKE